MGADHAILYDSLKEVGEEPNANRVAGKYFSSASLPKYSCHFGKFYSEVTAFTVYDLIAIDLLVQLCQCFASFLTEPKFKEKC